MFDIIKLAKSATSIQTLLADDAFKTALNAIAVVELKYAQDALSKIEDNPQPGESLNQVLSHLETAQLSFRQFWLSPVTGFVRRYKSETQALLDARTCCLIALIHYAQGDDQALVIDSLNSAKEAIAFEEKTGIIDTLFHVVNPVNFIDFFFGGSGLKFDELFIPNSEFREFEKILTKRKVVELNGMREELLKERRRVTKSEIVKVTLNPI